METVSVWSALDSICTNVHMISTRLAFFVSLLDNGYDKDIEGIAVEGLGSLMEREREETERISKEIHGILQRLRKGEATQKPR